MRARATNSGFFGGFWLMDLNDRGARERIFSINYHQYYLGEYGLDVITDDMYTGFNGLISVSRYDNFAVIMTGTGFGVVSVRADWCDSEPPLELDDWDDVVEVSMLFEDEPGILSSMDGYEGEMIPDLEPGAYRIRVHVRGRDRGCELDNVPGVPVEEHLIQAWPADMARETWYKLTDNYGSSIRARPHIRHAESIPSMPSSEMVPLSAPFSVMKGEARTPLP